MPADRRRLRAAASAGLIYVASPLAVAWAGGIDRDVHTCGVQLLGPFGLWAEVTRFTTARLTSRRLSSPAASVRPKPPVPLAV